MKVTLSHGRLSVDASVGFAQSFDDLQSVEQLVGAPDPQQVLPAESVSRLHQQNGRVQFMYSVILPSGETRVLTVSSEMFWKA